jgi:predicted CoA-binding protein
MKGLRKVSMVVAFAFFGFSLTPAIAAQQPKTESTTVWVNEEGEEIDFTQLPQAVQDAFNDGEYAKWNVDKVYKMQKDNKIWYQLSVTNEGQSKDIKYDENGQEVKEKHQG